MRIGYRCSHGAVGCAVKAGLLSDAARTVEVLTDGASNAPVTLCVHVVPRDTRTRLACAQPGRVCRQMLHLPK